MIHSATQIKVNICCCLLIRKKILLKISLNYWPLIESTYSDIEEETSIHLSKSIFYAYDVEDLKIFILEYAYSCRGHSEQCKVKYIYEGHNLDLV